MINKKNQITVQILPQLMIKIKKVTIKMNKHNLQLKKNKHHQK